MPLNKIVIKGAREHNLKDIDIEIPRDSLVVITGVSGSGKSTLAFDTIYAEGQRRYVESLSSYARQFLEQMEKPDVDSIEGLSPSISIDQRTTGKNPRSTVGTITEIYDYLRLLFTRIGKPYCYRCGREITSQTIQQMVERVMELPSGSMITIFSPIVRGRKGEYKKELLNLRKEGFLKARIDGKIRYLEEEIELDRNRHHNIEVIIDRLIIRQSITRRLTDSIEIASRLSKGIVLVEYGIAKHGEGSAQKQILFNEHLSCIECGISYPEIVPKFFSFNNPYGACPECRGIGVVRDGVSELEEDEEASNIEVPCPVCGGLRLKKESLHIKIERRSIGDLSSMTISELLDFLKTIRFRKIDEEVGYRVLREIIERLEFLKEVGLDYLTLNRRSSTLSGGESHRIRLASQIGSALSGVLYILDEPTIGLHQRDNKRLIRSLKKLRDMGNSVIVVEHDEETIRSADHIIDMGPGAGEKGGEIIVQGSLEELLESKESLTGRYLKGELEIPIPANRRSPQRERLILKGVCTNNLKDITVSIPLGLFVCVTGVSGSGKSSLVIDTIYKVLSHHLYKSPIQDGLIKEIKGIEQIDRVIVVDQSPIGRTPRSNPSTYSGAFTYIRKLFSMLPDSRVRGYGQGRFSFNVRGGRCEKCRGGGVLKIEMHFLPDVYVRCDQCSGKRYNKETLSIRYKGKNISEILEMTVAEALDFFCNIPGLSNKLKVLDDVGLSYIRLGQPATTLSGGEAQRLKLSKELSKRSTGRTLYILDEPTTGLHFHDINKLVSVLHRLVDSGNTVLVIEHNLDVIKSADYIIDLGPEGGENGGRIVASGTPEDVAEVKGSYTGSFLKFKLSSHAIKPELKTSKNFYLTQG